MNIIDKIKTKKSFLFLIKIILVFSLMGGCLFFYINGREKLREENIITLNETKLENNKFDFVCVGCSILFLCGGYSVVKLIKKTRKNT